MGTLPCEIVYNTSGTYLSQISLLLHVLILYCNHILEREYRNFNYRYSTFTQLLPFVEISSRARIDVSGDTATITLDETVNGTYECRVDDEAFRPCTQVYSKTY